MKPKVIKTGRDYQTALAHVETLMDKSSPAEAELELWSLLVEKYEEEHFPIAAPDPIEAIRFRMEQAGLAPADLQPYMQSKSKVSEVMNRKRPLSLSMIAPGRASGRSPWPWLRAVPCQRRSDISPQEVVLRRTSAARISTIARRLAVAP